MEVLIQLFVSICSLLIIVFEIVVFARLALQSPHESDDGKYKEKARTKRKKAIVFSFLTLALMLIYYLVNTYRFYRLYHAPNPNSPLRPNEMLIMFELWIESLQKSFLFYVITIIVPFISSKRFRILHVKEGVSETFIEWYSFLRVFSYPLIYVVFGSGSELSIYLIGVLSLSETCLLLSVYSLLLSKIITLGKMLGDVQLITRYEVEAVINEVRAGILGLLLYLFFDLVSKVAAIILFFLPGSSYPVISDKSSLIGIILLVLSYHYVAKLVFIPSRGVYESIQKMEDIKKHATSTFLNLNGRRVEDSNTVPLNGVPDI